MPGELHSQRRAESGGRRVWRERPSGSLGAGKFFRGDCRVVTGTNIGSTKSRGVRVLGLDEGTAGDSAGARFLRVFGHRAALGEAIPIRRTLRSGGVPCELADAVSG